MSLETAEEESSADAESEKGSLVLFEEFEVPRDGYAVVVVTDSENSDSREVCFGPVGQYS